MPKLTKEELAAALRGLGRKKTWVGMVQGKKAKMAEQAANEMDVPGVPGMAVPEPPLAPEALPEIADADAAVDFYKQILAGGADPTDFTYGGAQYGFVPVDSDEPIPSDMAGEMFVKRFLDNKAGLKVTKRKK